MKVSVIIPLYNQARFVERAVRSALDQKEVVEVVVIDDGSDDGGPDELRKSFGNDPRVKIFTQPDGKRRGAGSARNIGLKQARQPFIAFLDADDFMLPNRFSKTKSLFENHSNADGVYEALGEEIGEKVTMMKRAVSPERLFFEMEPFGKNGHFSVCGLTLKAEALREVDGFSEKLEIGEDTEWLARLVLSCSLIGGSLDRAVALRSVDGSSTTAKSLRGLTDKVKMARLLIEWSKKSSQSDEVKKTLVDLYLKYHYEQNRLFSEKSSFSKKRSDFNAALFIMRNYSNFWGNRKVRYFFKTIVGWPVKEHLDYYDRNATE